MKVGDNVYLDGDDAIFTIITIDNIAGKVRISCKESGIIIVNMSDLKLIK